MEFNELESLRLFSVPDLSELPLLACWEHLDHFLGVDIDEIAGKDIKKQLKVLEKERVIETHISKLRRKTWFATEYNNPFKDWEGEIKDLYSDWEILQFKTYVFDDEHPNVPKHQHAVNKLVARKSILLP